MPQILSDPTQIHFYKVVLVLALNYGQKHAI